MLATLRNFQSFIKPFFTVLLGHWSEFRGDFRFFSINAKKLESVTKKASKLMPHAPFSAKINQDSKNDALEMWTFVLRLRDFPRMDLTIFSVNSVSLLSVILKTHNESIIIDF